jgi:hypothetical protein
MHAAFIAKHAHSEEKLTRFFVFSGIKTYSIYARLNWANTAFLYVIDFSTNSADRPNKWGDNV